MGSWLGVHVPKNKSDLLKFLMSSRTVFQEWGTSYQLTQGYNVTVTRPTVELVPFKKSLQSEYVTLHDSWRKHGERHDPTFLYLTCFVCFFLICFWDGNTLHGRTPLYKIKPKGIFVWDSVTKVTFIE